MKYYYEVVLLLLKWRTFSCCQNVTKYELGSKLIFVIGMKDALAMHIIRIHYKQNL
jgi:hypothetical protein